MQLTLKRLGTDDDGTYGVLMYSNTPLCLTLEESWKDNQQNISCIPAGIYKCIRKYSPTFKVETFEIADIPNRSHVIFHVGNTEINTQGCVLTGSSFGELRALDDDSGEMEIQSAVLSSKVAFDKMMKKLEGIDEFLLYVVWT